MSGDIPVQFRPRQCHVVKWPEFQGYGFNLHAEKGKAGQYIGKIDENSPAEAAGLKEGDRIVEVNGVNIGNENHQQVVTRIKSGGDETRLLVVDTAADNWFKENKRVIKSDMPDVVFISAQRSEEGKEEAPEPEISAPVEPEPEPEPEPVPVPEPEPVIAPVLSQAVNGDSEDSLYRPRLCHLRIWPTFQGYGFNLHAERDKPGQFIGLVDDNSPASTAGLKVNDRIVEVNGANVERETHVDVISRIKAIPGETKLLVVDRETDNYYRNKGQSVSSSMSVTDYIASPSAQPDVSELGQEAVAAAITESAPAESAQPEEEDVNDVAAEIADVALEVEGEENGQEAEEEVQKYLEEKREEVVEEPVIVSPPEEPVFEPPPPPPEELEPEPEEPVNGLKSAAPVPSEPEYTVATQQQAVEPPKPVAAPTKAAAQDGTDGLELNLSVSEMKERLKAKKRQDPRLAKIPFEQKYKEFQRM